MKLSYCSSSSPASVAPQLASDHGLFSNSRPDVPVLCWTFSGIIRGCNRWSVLILSSHHSRGLATGFLPLNFLFTTFSFLYSSITHSNCVTSSSYSSEQYISLCQVHLYYSSYINERSSVREILCDVSSICNGACTMAYLNPTVYYKQVGILTIEGGNFEFRNVGKGSSFLFA